jgi:periplasmic divalent cation tolerance protein
VDTNVTGCCQVTTTLPDPAAAEKLASIVVAERLAACAQVLGPVWSIYRWNGEVEQTQEWYCCLKTTVGRLPDLEKRIRELHPYEVPEVISVPITHGNDQYLEWVRREVQEP